MVAASLPTHHCQGDQQRSWCAELVMLGHIVAKSYLARRLHGRQLVVCGFLVAAVIFFSWARMLVWVAEDERLPNVALPDTAHMQCTRLVTGLETCTSLNGRYLRDRPQLQTLEERAMNKFRRWSNFHQECEDDVLQAFCRFTAHEMGLGPCDDPEDLGSSRSLPPDEWKRGVPRGRDMLQDPLGARFAFALFVSERDPLDQIERLVDSIAHPRHLLAIHAAGPLSFRGKVLEAVRRVQRRIAAGKPRHIPNSKAAADGFPDDFNDEEEFEQGIDTINDFNSYESSTEDYIKDVGEKGAMLNAPNKGKANSAASKGKTNSATANKGSKPTAKGGKRASANNKDRTTAGNRQVGDKVPSGDKQNDRSQSDEKNEGKLGNPLGRNLQSSGMAIDNDDDGAQQDEEDDSVGRPLSKRSATKNSQQVDKRQKKKESLKKKESAERTGARGSSASIESNEEAEESGSSHGTFEVIMLATQRTHWGHWSLVQIELAAIHALLSTGREWDYLINLSGTHYPVGGPIQMARKFADQMHDPVLPPNFLEIDYKMRDYWVEDRLLQGLKYICTDFREPSGQYISLPYTRPLPPNVAMYKGSQWHILSRGFVEYVGRFNSPRMMYWRRLFRYAWIPDESFFQTVLMHSPFSITLRNQSSTFFKFPTHDYHPKLLTSDDLFDVLQTDQIFIRKVDRDQSRPLLDFLDGKAVSDENFNDDE